MKRRSACAALLRQTARLFGATEIEGGFPHSDIPGSKPVRGSPGLIAAYHVLHRLSAPRHPPDTLMALDCSHRQSAFYLSPTRRRRQTHSGAKRPVLLQTHPGILAVSQRTHDWCSKDRIHEATVNQAAASRPARLPFAPSGPRPNALPLHNVRYRKVLAEAAKIPFDNAPLKIPPDGFRRSQRPSRERTDKSHRRIRIVASALKLLRPERANLRFLLATPCLAGTADACRRCLPPLTPKHWWSQTGSNRRPHACKARALPTELWPRMSEWPMASCDWNPFAIRHALLTELVGLGGLEPPTSRLSSARSNQLSYKPGRSS